MALGLRKGAKKETAMQAMVEKKGKGCHSLPAGVAVGKATQIQNGLLIGQSQNVGRRPQAPETVHSGSIWASLLSLGSPPVVKEEPEDESGQLWETQWQDFLSTVEVSPAPSRAPELPPESTPWDDAGAFLAAFEQVAEVFRWPREEWVARLLPTLTGEAELVFSSLEAGDREDYGKVKAALLQEDAVSRERNRQRFRNFCYQEADGPREAYRRLQELCSRWLKIEKHSKEQILEVLILEQFVAILPPVIQKWVKEHRVESGVHAVSLAEEFLRRRWLSGVKEEQATHPQGEGSMNFAEEEQVPLNTVEGPRLSKESKTEDLTDLSDGYLSADNGKEGDDNDSLTQGSSHQTEPQEIFPESDSDHSSSYGQEKGNLRDSVEACEDGRKNLCSECRKSFPDKLSLQQHQRTHHMSHLPEEPPKDLTSGGGSHYKTDLEIYQKILAGEYPCVCLHCGEKFTSRTSLVAHQKIHRGENLPFSLPEVTVYICNECGETFSCLEDHNVHQRTHREVRLGASVGCQKKTEQPSNQGKPLIICAQQEPYRCTDCGESFVRLSTYRIHRITHSRSKPGSLLLKTPPWSKYCPVCQKAFPDYWKLKRHCASHKKPQEVDMCADFLKQIPVQRRRSMRQKSFMCSECGKTFRWNAPFMRHKLIHSREKLYKCTPCGQKFVSSLSLGQHRKVVHKGGKLGSKFPTTPGKSSTCPTCRKSFKSHLARVVHERIHKGRKLHTCSHCGKAFVFKKSLLSHEKKVHQVKTGGHSLAQAPKTGRGHLTCSNCRRRFSNPKNLERHQRIHTGERVCQCSECGERFLWESSLAWHRKKVHNVKKPLQQTPDMEGKSYPCSKCGKKFKQASILRRHECLPAESKTYKCAGYRKGFSNRSSLGSPRKDPFPKIPDPLLKKTSSSRQKKLYICSECGKRFNWPSHFKMHQNVHMKKKLFQCADCGKRFQWEISLHRHRKKFHNGRRQVPLPQTGPSGQEETHFCHDCGKFFKKRLYLIRHRRLLHHEQNVIDPKLRIYRCLECGLSFSRLLDLGRHKDVHSREKLYKCTDCGKDFTQSSALAMHKEGVHKGKKLVPVLQRIPDLQGKPFKCSVQPGLVTLQAIQTSRNCQACPECGKILSCRSSLLRHLIIHSGVKSHKCDQCWRSFFYKENLVRHKRVHKGFQKFTMEVYESNIQVKMNSSSQEPAGSSPPHMKSEDIFHLWEEANDKCTAQVELPLTGGSLVPAGSSPALTGSSSALTGSFLPHQNSEDTSLLQEVAGNECTVQVGDLPLIGGSPELTGCSLPHKKSEDTSQLQEELGNECTVYVGELPQTASSPVLTGGSVLHEKSEDTSHLREEAGGECTVQVGQLPPGDGSLSLTASSPPHEKSEDTSHLQEEAGNECTVQVGELPSAGGSPAPTGSSPPQQKSEDTSHLREEAGNEAGNECTVQIGELPLTGGSLAPTSGSPLHEKSEDASHLQAEAGNECTLQAGELPPTGFSPAPTGFSPAPTSVSLPHEKSDNAFHLLEEAGNEYTIQAGELPPTDGSLVLTGFSLMPTSGSPPHKKSEDASHLWEQTGNECTVQVGELPLAGGFLAPTGVSPPHEKSEDTFHWQEKTGNKCTVQDGELPDNTDAS